MSYTHRGSQIEFTNKGKKPNYKHGHDGICTVLSAKCHMEFADCDNCARLQRHEAICKENRQKRQSRKPTKSSDSGSSITGIFITVVIVLAIIAYLVYHGYL